MGGYNTPDTMVEIEAQKSKILWSGLLYQGRVCVSVFLYADILLLAPSLSFLSAAALVYM